MIKTYKYRLKPTKEQRRLLKQSLELCRMVYNKTLEIRRDTYQRDRKTLNYYATAKMLPEWKKEKPELKQVHSQVLQNVQVRVDLAFQAFFRRVKQGEKEVGYPRFKGYGRYDSLTFPQYGYAVRLNENKTLSVSKIGDIKVIQHRPIEGEIKTATIQRQLNRWYVCLTCEVDIKPLVPSEEIVGIDLGLKTFAVLSNGEQIKRQRWIKNDTKDIARLQRKKEKLKMGSADRGRAILALRHAYARATNRRTNFAHQESRKIINRYGLIVLEKLEIKEMQGLGNKVINRNIGDVAWRQFTEYITYKAEEAGRSVIFVNPRGTTQECSGCGVVVKKDLSVRIHDCPHCGLKIDRDLNAAKNILTRGITSLGVRSTA